MNPQEQFILDWCREHQEASALTSDFHDEFAARFGGKRKLTNFGAQMVYKAQRLLRQMHLQRKLARVKIRLSGHEAGFPKYVWSYCLPEQTGN